MDAQPLLKIKFNCFYDYQKTLNKNLTIIFGWFVLLCNMITKYGIQDTNFYNFNEISFIMDIIISFMVITRLNKHKKIKFVQFGN